MKPNELVVPKGPSLPSLRLPRASLQLGDVIAGKYRMERVLGEGGMGLVLEATHLQLEQRVAIKVLAGEARGSEEAVARFTREARAAARIRSEHVVRVYDVSALEGGTPYLVMEYLEGADLEAVLRTQGPLSVVDAVSWVLQACEALAEAHTHGIVHRDLKPANLFLSERADGSQHVKILDFGVSKLLPRQGVGDMTMTRTTSLVGSPLYMAPEQMRGAKGADLRADIWSLGIILFELLTGIPPFEGESLTEVCASIVADPPRPLAIFCPELPEGLESVVMRCLEKDPGQRFQNVAELAAVLCPFAPEQGAISVKRTTRVIHRVPRASEPPPPPPRSQPPSQLETTIPEVSERLGATMASFGLTGAPTRKRLPLHMLLAASGAAVSIVAALSLMSILREPAQPPALSSGTAAAAVPQALEVHTTSAPALEPPVAEAPMANEAVHPPPSAMAAALEKAEKKETAHHTPKVAAAPDAGTALPATQGVEYQL